MSTTFSFSSRLYGISKCKIMFCFEALEKLKTMDPPSRAEDKCYIRYRIEPSGKEVTSKMRQSTHFTIILVQKHSIDV
jgi:hypothetical protein